VSSGYRDAVGFVAIISCCSSARRTVRARGTHRLIARAAVALGAVAAVTAPLWVANPYHLHVLIMAGIFTILALSLNLLLGYTGQLSLGHAAFFGIGAYTSRAARAAARMVVLAGAAGGRLASGLAGWAIGRLALKLGRPTSSLVTISFAGVISLVSINWMDLTNVARAARRPAARGSVVDAAQERVLVSRPRRARRSRTSSATAS